MRLLILHTLLVLSTLNSFSQDEVFDYYTKPPGRYNLKNEITVTPFDQPWVYEPIKLKAEGLIKDEIMGSQYYLNYWHKGQFQLSGGKYIEAYLIFDIFSNTLLVSKNGEQTDFVLSPEKFRIKNQLFSKYNHQYLNAGNSFYQKIKHPHFTILKAYSCTYTDYSKNGHNGYDRIVRPNYEGSFEKDQHFYFVINNRLSRISSNRSFYKLFDKKRHLVREFVESQDLDLTLKADVLKLADMIASL
ncbi:MAG: hypothetical protein NXI00_18385 [Cytophagales bacterium]|nr:hypothetical protein [Cytophagales bacterium]